MKLDSLSQNMCDLCFPYILLSTTIFILVETKSILALHKFLEKKT